MEGPQAVFRAGLRRREGAAGRLFPRPGLDADGLARLNEEETQVWGVAYPEKKDQPVFAGGYLAAASHHFGFNQDQSNKAAAMVLVRVQQYRNAKEQWEPEIKEYEYGLKQRAGTTPPILRGRWHR